MELSFRKANPDEYPCVRAFYDDLIDGVQGMRYHPKWKKGIYPEDAFLASSVGNGELYLAEENGRVVGAMVLNHSAADGYEKAKWKIAAGADEIYVIHILGVSPAYMRQGIGKRLVAEAVHLAEENGMKALRLDVLVGNLPAEKLYKSMGFMFIDRVTLFYEDTGRCDFDLYEYDVIGGEGNGR